MDRIVLELRGARAMPDSGMGKPDGVDDRDFVEQP